MAGPRIQSKDPCDEQTSVGTAGPASLLNIPSRRFYAVTGIPEKSPGDALPELRYPNSKVAAGLGNLSNDINLAARNAMDGIVGYITTTYGFDRQQA